MAAGSQEANGMKPGWEEEERWEGCSGKADPIRKDGWIVRGLNGGGEEERGMAEEVWGEASWERLARRLD